MSAVGGSSTLGAVQSPETQPTLASGPAEMELRESKLRPPSLGSDIPRTSLLETLAGARSRRLILVTAPAGYGKTTLLAHWANRMRRPLGWVTLSEHDNDPTALMTYVAAAVNRVARLEPAVFEALAEPGASIEARVVPRLAAAMAAIEGAFVLVLDDVQVIQDPGCVDAIDALVESVPPGSQLVLSGRCQPSLRIPSMRAAGLMLELGAEDLRMDDVEAAELIANSELKLTDTEVSKLVARTEGWPAGLYLGALAISAGAAGGAEPDGAVRGDDRFVADYLRVEVLAGLSAEDRRFLIRTSVLERLSGPLCDAVLGSAGSVEVLARIERSNLFVVPLDRHRRWYRYHDLLREMLRAELEHAEPELAPQLLTRASSWFAENGALGEAVAAAQAAGDIDAVWRLVATRAQTEYRHGRAATVDRWFEWLDSHDAPERDPAIAAVGAWFSALRGNADRAERWADIAMRATGSGGDGDGPPLRTWVALLNAVRCRRGSEAMLADATEAVELTPRSGPWWQTATLVLGLAQVLVGELDAADRSFADVAESAEASEGWNAASLALGERAAIALTREDWDAAGTFAERAQAIVEDWGMEGYPPNALVFAVAARIAVHRQEWDRADELLTRAQRLRPPLTHVLAPLAIQTRLELARTYAARPDPAGARTLLREARGLIGRGIDFGVLTAQADEIDLRLETARAQAPGASTLTTAELRLLPLLPTQLSFREIGERLFLSRHTIKSQAVSIYRKLDVTSRTDAVDRARELGLF